MSSDSITWFIDPLDGTKAFLRGNLAFVCMSIAAWDETGLLAGVVYNPFTDMLYSSAKSSSVYLNGSVLPPPRSFPLKEARLLIDFSNRVPLDLQKQLAIADLDDVIGRSYRLGGGISQHLMLVAQGTLHGALFWGAGRKGKYWDIAAAALILERLGIKMTTLEGNSIHPTDKIFDQLIIARTSLHAEMLRWVEQLKKKYPQAD
ncbi:MAG: inositol monophosphatase family protein [Candidatus Hodarchaeales archaeon]